MSKQTKFYLTIAAITLATMYAVKKIPQLNQLFD